MDETTTIQEVERHLVKTDMHKYNLVIPNSLFDELQELAASQYTTVLDLLRRFIKLGLMIVEDQEQGAEFIIRREGEPDERIRFIV